MTLLHCRVEVGSARVEKGSDRVREGQHGRRERGSMEEQVWGRGKRDPW